MTEYDYTKSPVNVDALSQQIQLSTISTALDHINYYDTALAIFFVSDLSSGDKSTLDTIVTNHNGQPIQTSFVKVQATTTTTSNSSSYVVLDSMTTPNLLPGIYWVVFRGDFSTNVPLLSNPGIYISVFNDSVQVTDSQVLQISNNSGAAFTMVTMTQVSVSLNKQITVEWKTNGSGNTMTCINRMLVMIGQK